jgi:iron complex outermembrane recepter protein
MLNQYPFKNLRSLIFLIFLHVVSYSKGQAQVWASTGAVPPTGQIRGVVSTTDGSPVEFVNIMLKGTTRGGITAVDGSFQIRNVKPGDYILVATYVGLQAQEKAVTVMGGQTTQLDLVLPRSARQLSEVVITEWKSVNRKPVSVGKIAIAPLDLPQSVVTIEQEVLEQQQILRLSEVLQNVNGMYQMGNTGGIQEELASRGFALGSNNTFKNGSRFNNGVMPEMSSLERVEVHKGSNAILYGNVAAGGVLNLVTKKPKFTNGGEVNMRVGSYNFYKPSLDVYGAINNSEKVAFRINTTYENARSYRDFVGGERFYFNPSFLVKVGQKTEVLVEGDYLDDSRTPDYGIGAINYTIPGVPRSRYLGVSWGYNNVIQKSATATITHQVHENWTLRGVASSQYYDANQFGAARPNASNAAVQADGTWRRNLQRTASTEKYSLAQLDLTGQFHTGLLKHQVLIGTDVDRYRVQTPAFAIFADRSNPGTPATFYDVINIFNPTYESQRNDIPAVAVTATAYSLTNRMGFYAQDLISLTEKVKVLGGIRYSYQRTGYTGKKYDDAFSPRLGVVYQPLKTTSLFASYANSFSVNTAVSTTGKADLAPSLIDQFEVGVKNDLFNGIVSANVTAYKIVNSNVAQLILPGSPNYNEKVPTAQELAGTTASKGLEIDLMTKSFLGFSFIGGYSYNNTRFVKSSVNVVGSRLRYNPAHTANASLFYSLGDNSLLKGLNAGITTFYTGDRLAGRSTRTNVANDSWKLISLPNFFQFDAHLGYTWSNLVFRVKATNLLNKLSYQAHDDNSINPIAPRQFTTSISYKF